MKLSRFSQIIIRMSSSAVVSGDLTSLLGADILSQIPDHAQVVLKQVWATHIDTLRTDIEKVKGALTKAQTDKV